MEKFNSTTMGDDYNTSQSNLNAPQQQQRQQQLSGQRQAGSEQAVDMEQDERRSSSRAPGRSASAMIVDEMSQDLQNLSREAPLDGGESTFGAYSTLGPAASKTTSVRSLSLRRTDYEQEYEQDGAEQQEQQQQRNEQEELEHERRGENFDYRLDEEDLDGQSARRAQSPLLDQQQAQFVRGESVRAVEQMAPDNVDIQRPLQQAGFLVSFMVDARGGAMRGCRHSGVRVIIPPGAAPMPMRITCRYLRRERLVHPPPLMEGEACASKIMEVGPAGAKFLAPVLLEVPHFASLRGQQREIIILRSDSGEVWREHLVEADQQLVAQMIEAGEQAEQRLRAEQSREDQENWRPASSLAGRITPFDGYESAGNELAPADDSKQAQQQQQQQQERRLTRIVTTEFPQYFAIISRIKQEVHTIGPDGSVVDSQVVPKVQAIFTEGAVTKRIKVGLQNKTSKQERDRQEAGSPLEPGRPVSPASQQSTDGTSTLKSNSRPGSKQQRRRRFLACFGASHGSRDQLNDATDATDELASSSAPSSAASSSIGGDSPRVPANEKLVERRHIIEDISDSEEAVRAASSPARRKKRHAQQHLVPDDYYIEQEPPLLLNMEPKTYGKRLADSSAQTELAKGASLSMSTRADGRRAGGLLGGRRRRNKQELTIHCAATDCELADEQRADKPEAEARRAAVLRDRQLDSLVSSRSLANNSNSEQAELKSRTCTIQTDSDSVIVNYVTIQPNSAEATQVILDDGYVSGSGDLKRQHGKGIFSPFCVSTHAEEEEEDAAAAAAAAVASAADEASSLSADERRSSSKAADDKAAARTKKSKKKKSKSSKLARDDEELKDKSASADDYATKSAANQIGAEQAATTSGGEEADESLLSTTNARSQSPASKEFKQKIKRDKQEKARRDKLEKRQIKQAEEAKAKLEKDRKRLEKEAARAEKAASKRAESPAGDKSAAAAGQPNQQTQRKTTGSAVLGTITKTIQNVKFAPSPTRDQQLEQASGLEETGQESVGKLEADEKQSSASAPDSLEQAPDSTCLADEKQEGRPRQEDGHDLIRLSIGSEAEPEQNSQNDEQASRGPPSQDTAAQDSSAPSAEQSPAKKHKFKIKLGKKSSSSKSSADSERAKADEQPRQQQQQPLKPILKQQSSTADEQSSAELIIGEPATCKLANQLVSQATDEAVRAAHEAKQASQVLSESDEAGAVTSTTSGDDSLSASASKHEAKRRMKEDKQRIKKLERASSDEEKRLAKEAKRLAKSAQEACKRAEFEANKAAKLAAEQAERQAAIAKLEAERAIRAAELGASLDSEAGHKIRSSLDLEKELKKVNKLAEQEAKRIAQEAELEARRIARENEREAKQQAKEAKAEAQRLAKEAQKLSKQDKAHASLPTAHPREEEAEANELQQVKAELETTLASPEQIEAAQEAPLPEAITQSKAEQKLQVVLEDAKPVVETSDEQADESPVKSKSSSSKGVSLAKIKPKKSSKKSKKSKEETKGKSKAQDDAQDTDKSADSENDESKSKSFGISLPKLDISLGMSKSNKLDGPDDEQQSEKQVPENLPESASPALEAEPKAEPESSDSSSKKKHKKGKKSTKPKREAPKAATSPETSETASKSSFLGRLFRSKPAKVAAEQAVVSNEEPIEAELAQAAASFEVPSSPKPIEEPVVLSEMYPSDPDNIDGEMILEVNVPQNLIDKSELLKDKECEQEAPPVTQTVSVSSTIPSTSEQEDQEATLVNISQMAFDEDVDEVTENIVSQAIDLDAEQVEPVQRVAVAFTPTEEVSLTQQQPVAASDTEAPIESGGSAELVAQEVDPVVAAGPQQVLSQSVGRASADPVDFADEKKQKELEVKLNKEAKKREKEEAKLRAKQEKEEKRLAELEAKKQVKEEKLRKKWEASEARRLEKLAKEEAKKEKSRVKLEEKEENKRKKQEEKARESKNRKSKDKVAELKGEPQVVAEACKSEDDDDKSRALITSAEDAGAIEAHDPTSSKVKVTTEKLQRQTAADSSEPSCVERRSETIVTTSTGAGLADELVDTSNMEPVNEEIEVERIEEEEIGEDGTVTKRTRVVETKYVTLRQEEIKMGERREIPIEEWQRMQREQELEQERQERGSTSSGAKCIEVQVERSASAKQAERQALPVQVGAYKHEELDKIRSMPSYFAPERPAEIKAELSPKRELKKRFKLNRLLIKRANKLAKSEAKRAKKEQSRAESEIGVCDEAAREARKQLRLALKESRSAAKVAAKLHKKMDKIDKKLEKRAQKLDKRQRKLDKRAAKLAKKAAKKQAKLAKKSEKRQRKQRSSSPGSLTSSSSKRASIRREDIGAPMLKSSSRMSIGATEILPALAATVQQSTSDSDQQATSEQIAALSSEQVAPHEAAADCAPSCEQQEMQQDGEPIVDVVGLDDEEQQVDELQRHATRAEPAAGQ